MSYIYYKDYVGSLEYSEEDKVFHGKLIGIKDLVSYEGDSATSLIADFHESVDEYLDFCNRQGRKPDRPFKGSFNVRVKPELHRQAALAAETKGVSLNAFVEEAIRHSL